MNDKKCRTVGAEFETLKKILICICHIEFTYLRTYCNFPAMCENQTKKKKKQINWKLTLQRITNTKHHNN